MWTPFPEFDQTKVIFIKTLLKRIDKVFISVHQVRSVLLNRVRTNEVILYALNNIIKHEHNGGVIGED